MHQHYELVAHRSAGYLLSYAKRIWELRMVDGYIAPSTCSEGGPASGTTVRAHAVPNRKDVSVITRTPS
jgi:hypothetical protein